ncbi:MAG: hypothetical protein C5B50_27470 [Verrucomicrobia bacterium]|nr:MAG: hypothetical protein C5B50_27470 [Verrucomicrobiota bacterium]
MKIDCGLRIADCGLAGQRLGLRQSSGAFNTATNSSPVSFWPWRRSSGFTFHVSRFTHHAFTLIEVIISSSLMALILASGYVCFSAAIASQKAIEPRADLLQNARVAMSLMSADLRSACSLSKDFDLLGMHRMLGNVDADNLDFATHHYSPKQSNEGDYCEESLFIDRDPRTGELVLWRRRNPRISLDPLTGGVKEEIARGVAGLRFEYFDGFDWYDSWGDVQGQAKAQNSLRQRSNLSGMPYAIRITLWLDQNPPGKKTSTSTGETAATQQALMFQTVTRINLASSLSQSAASSDSSDQSSQSPSSGDQGGNPQ